MSQSVCSDFFEGIWENDECYIACTSNQTCCDAIGGNWSENECIELPSGVWITGNETLTISNDMNIDNFESLNADIECIIDTSYSIEFPADENMTLIERGIPVPFITDRRITEGYEKKSTIHEGWNGQTFTRHSIEKIQTQTS